MREYLKAQNKMNETLINGSISSDELERFSKSDYRWANHRSSSGKTRNKIVVKKGQVYQFEFGKNFIPEMSYEHRGLVIGVKKRILYVLPIFSYHVQKHPDVYHPVKFPCSQSDLYLLESVEFPFLTHDSVLKLNDIRSVSIDRILYKHNGQMDLKSDVYTEIERLVFQKYFPSFYYEYEQNRKENDSLKETVKRLETENDTKENAIHLLLRENEALMNKAVLTER